jgi:hypothetical protein
LNISDSSSLAASRGLSPGVVGIVTVSILDLTLVGTIDALLRSVETCSAVRVGV